MNTRDENQLDSVLINSQQRRFVHEHQTCAMCETQLDILHEVDKTELKVKEQAHCPCCGIRVRSTQHLMH